VSIIVEDKTNFILFRIADGIFIREGVRELLEKVKPYREQGKSRFIIDFTGCDYISSEGLGAMSELWKYCKSQKNGKIGVIFNPDPENDVRYLFDTIGLTTMMKDNIFVSTEEAEKAFS
jgi:anti-anti-sigma regulatory factor